jgi:Ca2+-binding RTX toxin-like protein
MAAPLLWGSQIDLPSGIQFPHMTALSNGTFLFVGKAGTFPNTKLKAWIYNADGSLKAEQILDVPDHKVPGVYGKLEIPAIDPMAVELPDGQIAITWTVHTPTSGNTYVAPWVCIYSADLAPIGAPKPVFDPTSGARDYAETIVALADGTLVISDRNERDGHAYLRVFSPDGTRSPELDLGTAGGIGLGTIVTDVTALSDGNVAVVVRTNTSTLTGYVLTPSGSGGPSLSAPFPITMSDSPIKDGIKVTALQDGGFVVTWMEQGVAGTPEYNAFLRVYNSEGNAVSDVKPVSPLTLPDLLLASHSDVLALPDGGFAVAYEKATEFVGGVPGLEVHLAIFDKHGERLSDDVRVSQEATTTSIYLEELHLMADGRILVRHSQGIQIVDPRGKAISMKGSTQDDHYIGTAFNDTFDGGAGADRLEGADGDDTYVVDNAGDRVIERVDEGIDTIETSISYALSAHVEHLTATGSASIALTGNTLANTITGNAGGNQIDGGAGADIVRAGLGSDTLDGGAGADVLDGGDGFDFVSFASFSVGVRTGLALGSGDGDTWTSIEGIIGSAHADTLIGNGASRLQGSGGDDTYEVRVGDLVDESAGGGRDTVLVSASYSLSASAEIEIMKLSGISSKTSAHLTGSDTNNEILGHGGKNTLTGRSGNDVLKASSGNDTLKGDAGADTLYGGNGNDKLYGGKGTDNDVFVFDTKPNTNTNVDRIHDFDPRYDVIYLENKVFTKLGKGSAAGVKFKADMFVKGVTAKDREDRMIYDTKTGALYYDQDGIGARAQVKIANLSKNLKLSAGDFFVI